MNGFAPLIEGFLAFALTMLALTTGVSAIVGALHHLRRKHARGLRDMVRLLYLRELLPLLDDKKPAAGPRTVAMPPDLMFDPNVPVPHVRERLGSGDDAISPVATGPQREPTEGERRAEFIYDMTFMPLPTVVEQLERDPDYWRKKLESAEKLAGQPWHHAPLHMVRLFRYWKTLRYSLGALTDQEFRERLASSDMGDLLQKKEAWSRVEPALAGRDELIAHLLKKFQTIGGASSENFARHSRGWSVAVGFFLALFLNIDSLDLLNSYLTDPALRQQVIAAQSAENQSPQAPATGTATTLASARAALGTATDRLGDTADDLNKTLETFTAALNTEERQRFAQTVQGRLQDVVAQAKEVESGFGALDDDLTEAERAIRGVTQSLAASFPIGWKRFPNCTGESADLRCQRQRAAPTQTNPASQWPIVAFVATIASSAPFIGPTLSRWSTVLMTASGADPDGFNQWVVGVLLTGLLLGLGTPFWVQAVSGMRSLRPRWNPKEEPEKNTSPAGAAVGSNTGAAQGA